jgi:hypothetical protein
MFSWFLNIARDAFKLLLGQKVLVEIAVMP